MTPEQPNPKILIVGEQTDAQLVAQACKLAKDNDEIVVMTEGQAARHHSWNRPHVNIGTLGARPRAVRPLTAALLALGVLGGGIPMDVPLPRHVADDPKPKLSAADRERLAAAVAKRARKASRKS